MAYISSYYFLLDFLCIPNNVQKGIFISFRRDMPVQVYLILSGWESNLVLRLCLTAIFKKKTGLFINQLDWQLSFIDIWFLCNIIHILESNVLLAFWNIIPCVISLSATIMKKELVYRKAPPYNVRFQSKMQCSSRDVNIRMACVKFDVLNMSTGWW